MVKNTVVLGFWTLVISYPLPIVFAVLLNEVKQQHGLFKRVTQSISYLPHFVAVVVIVGLMYDFFSSDGIVNQMAVALTGEKWRILGSVGVVSATVRWLRRVAGRRLGLDHLPGSTDRHSTGTV